MKYGKIVLFFCIALPVSVLLRTLQLFFTVDAATGFFKNEYMGVGSLLLVLIFAVCAATAIICFTGHRAPDRPPQKNIFICLSSFLMAAAVGIELFAESFSGTVMAWQLALLMLTGVASIVYFAAFGLAGFISLSLPAVCAVIPAFYFIMRIICSFTAVSSLALISDNLLLIAAYCVLLLFFLCFGKLYNDIDSEYNFRKLMASGMVSVILCFTQSVPHIIINFVTSNGYQHTSNAANFALLAAGIFTAVFVFSYFSRENSAAHSVAEA